VLVINSGERKFGVVVDAMEGEDELVIKALDDQSITTDLVSGASILGDGRVVLILNMIALMERFTRGRASSGPADDGLAFGLAAMSARGDRGCCATRGPGRRPGMKKPVRVLVVDDSALMRKLIPEDPRTGRFDRSGGHGHGRPFALKKIEELSPDVVTLDLEMPGLNGIDTLKEIMRRWRLPVIVVSSHSTAGASITLKALALGAFDFVAKPQDVSARMPEIASNELIKKIRAAAQSAGCRPQFTA
jgi:CheY-like chemotaxis protein